MKETRTNKRRARNEKRVTKNRVQRLAANGASFATQEPPRDTVRICDQPARCSETALEKFELIERFADNYSDRIVITQRGWRSLKTCKTNFTLLSEAMTALCTDMFDLYHYQGGIDVRREFRNRTTLDYSRSAGYMTRKDRKLMRNYMDTYQRRVINCEAHIKYGNKKSDPNSVRIYFCFDREADKIVISHIGEHLENYSTRKTH